jgi:hypothetical protein
MPPEGNDRSHSREQDGRLTKQATRMPDEGYTTGRTRRCVRDDEDNQGDLEGVGDDVVDRGRRDGADQADDRDEHEDRHQDVGNVVPDPLPDRRLLLLGEHVGPVLLEAGRGVRRAQADLLEVGSQLELGKAFLLGLGEERVRGLRRSGGGIVCFLLAHGRSLEKHRQGKATLRLHKREDGCISGE